MTAIVTGRTTTGCATIPMTEAGTDSMTTVTTISITNINERFDGSTKMKRMKTMFFASLITAAAFAALVPEAAQARPHQVCHLEHHHRVCHWVR